MNNLIMNKKVINIINDTEDAEYFLKENEMLVVNCFFENIQNINISINQENNSCFILNYSGYIKSNAKININGNILGNNNKCVLNFRVIAENNEGEFNVNVKASENAVGNEIIENLKGINENGNITFVPVLEIDTNEVEASHFATVGNLDKMNFFIYKQKELV